jgi:hypothetical protein
VTLNSTLTQDSPKNKEQISSKSFQKKDTSIQDMTHEKRNKKRKKRKWDLGTNNSIPVETKRERLFIMKQG